MHRLLLTVAILFALGSSSGCAAYQWGNRSLYRPDIRTVHVPMVQSDSLRRNLGERLTEKICKEIELKTPYKLVDAAAADSILTARIIAENKKVLAENGLDEARDVCERLVRARATDADALALLGVIHLAAGRPDEAFDALRKALYLAPDHVEAVSHMMALCERRGDKAHAAALKRRLDRLTRAEGT